MKNSYQVIIIGTGFGGQLAAINLRKQGINDFLMLERRAFMGGTWCQNSYPGAAVDVQSPLYSIESEPYDWSQMFADQHELRAYTEHLIDKHGLRAQTLTEAEVSKAQWQADSQQWRVEVVGKEPLYARFLINASGPLSNAHIPDFKGRASFKGESFHSNNWNHDYDLRNKRVAVVGSGASAAQIIPEIAPKVEHLHVFQRSPHWVMPRADYVFKGWQRKLLKNKWAYRALRWLIYWALEFRVIGFKYSTTALNILGKRPAEKHLRQQVQDPILREQLRPDFTIGCKRIIISDTLYPAYCRSNVSLHDKHNGIQEITPKGIVAVDGREHELDLIIYCTGFDATDGIISYPVIGEQGQTLSDFWADFPRAYLGTTAPGFPNLFVVTGPNTGIGHTSALFIIESQMKYIMAAIQRVRSSAANTVSVSVQAEQAYTDHIHEQMARTVWQNGGCNSWYKSDSGKVIAMFPGFSFTFRRWASRFKMKDHEFS